MLQNSLSNFIKMGCFFNDTRGGLVPSSAKHAIPSLGQVEACVSSNKQAVKTEEKRLKKRKFGSRTIWKAKAKTMKVKKRRKEKQQAATCGIQAVNNALGAHVITRPEVDAAVTNLGRGGDVNGNYSAEPLHCALQRKQFKLQRIRGKGHMWLANQKRGKFLALGWHLSYDRPCHYIGIDADIGMVIDGAKKNSFRLDVGGLLACLSCGFTRIWEIKAI
jgi:hypothetical protein